MKPEECLGMLSEKGCSSKGGTTSGSLPGAEELDKSVDGVEESLILHKHHINGKFCCFNF